jgi:hypothetical protein
LFAINSIGNQHVRLFATAGTLQTDEPKIYPGTYEVTVFEAAPGTGGEEADAAMATAVAGAGLRPAAGGELQAEVDSDEIVFDIQLTRQRG